jgi:hypothetical protein
VMFCVCGGSTLATSAKTEPGAEVINTPANRDAATVRRVVAAARAMDVSGRMGDVRVTDLSPGER